MAPELMVDVPVPDKSCDVYSFYVVIWEVVCRKQPHEGRSPAWIMKFAAKRKKRLEIPKHVGCPERLDALMIRCAEIQPRRRPTMEACRRAIADVRADPVAPSLLRVEFPENALFTCQVVSGQVEVLDAPRDKLDVEATSPAYILARSSSKLSTCTDGDQTGDGRLSELDPGKPVDAPPLDRPVAPRLGSRPPRKRGDKLYVEAHVVAANGREDGEDQVYLKLANEEAYVTAFGPEGEILVKLVDSSIGAEHLAVEARQRGFSAVVEALLFHLAIMHAEAVLRLLACIFEILAEPEIDKVGGPDDAAVSEAVRVKACRRVVAALSIFLQDAQVQCVLRPSSLVPWPCAGLLACPPSSTSL